MFENAALSAMLTLKYQTGHYWDTLIKIKKPSKIGGL